MLTNDLWKEKFEYDVCGLDLKGSKEDLKVIGENVHR